MKRKRTVKKIKLIIIIVIFICLFVVFANFYDSLISGSVVEISRQYAVTEINKSINSAICDCIEKYNLTSSDFIFSDSENKSISANSVLINKLCAETAEKISDNLNGITIHNAELNLSMLSNIFSLLKIKFKYTVDVTSVGSAEADYETEFISAGINRTNLKIWLNIKAEVAIVDLFHTERLQLTRKVMIIDTIIDGEVPSTYFQLQN